jgi:RHS repeat-associated protein
MHVTRVGSLAAGNPSVPGSTQSSSLRYFHHDQLGSIAAISDEAGKVIERLAYDPWGKRRNTTGPSDVTDSLIGLATDRGFTEHEHLDEMGIIHMNGRLYDPLIARFMSADPFIQAPGNLQSYNRYAYVMNNPLNLTDPSGYFSFRQLFRGVVRIFAPVIAILPPKIASVLINVASLACGPWAPACAGAGQAGLAYYHGASTGDALRTGVRAGATAFLFQQAGDFAGVNGGAGSYAGYAAHAGAGCISSVASGGSCGSGALSAVVGYGATDLTSGWGNSFAALAGRFVVTVVAGGISSQIAGGKFANGAETAAYGYLFNCGLHECLKSAKATDVRGGFNTKGESLVYHPDNYNPGAASEILITGAFAMMAGMPTDALKMIEFSAMSTAELKALIAANGTNAALNAGGLFGSSIDGAKAALMISEVPANINRTILLAYREIATRNITADIQQIRIQVIDRLLGMIK